jgi:predicted nucleic acid-binding protein
LHEHAVDLLAAFPALVMHTVNVAELLVGTDRRAWAGLLATIRAHGFTVHDTTPEQLADARRRTGLRMSDACVIAVAEARHADAILTLDRNLLRAAAAEGFTTGYAPTTSE